MTSSVVEICNLALSHVRRGSINSLDENSLEAQQCNLHYEKARNTALKQADWGFNSKIAALTQLSSVTVFNWAYVWSYPNDCLQISHLIRNITTTESQVGQSAVALRVEGYRFRMPEEMPPVEYKVLNESGVKVIVTNEAELRANYRTPVEDVRLFSDTFVDALAHLLASRIAVALAGAKEGIPLRDSHLGLYTGFLNEARDEDANQRHYEEPDSEFVHIRGM